MGEHSVRLVRFDPWIFSSHSDLASAFLGQLARAVSADKRSVPELVKELSQDATVFADATAGVGGSPIPQPVSKIRVVLRAIKTLQFHPLPPHSAMALEEIRSRVASKLTTDGRGALVLIDDIDRLTPDEIKDVWDPDRWGYLYRVGLRDLFRTVRDIRRYANSLSFHMPLM